MISVKRYGVAAAAAAALASMALTMAPAATAATVAVPAPAKAASPQVGTATQSNGCAALSAQLTVELQAASTALAATPPDIPAAQAAVAAAQSTTAQLQAAQCLPTPTTPPGTPICLALTLQLHQELQALFSALAANPPDLVAAGAALNAMTSTVADLQANGCSTVL